MSRKQQAGEGGQGLLGEQDSPPPVSPGAHTVFMLRGLGSWRPGLHRAGQLAVEGFSNQTWRAGGKGCISTPIVPGAHTFLPWLSSP